MPLILSAFASGLLFGLGLIVSQMVNPAKVLGFLDVTGAWDPSLAFVMAGAVAVGFFAFRLARRRIELPARRDIDARLVGGAIVFGVGWGLAGFCPGPALVSFGSGQDKAVVFVVAMLAGMALFTLAERARRTLAP